MTYRIPKPELTRTWAERFLDLAALVGSWSKDPSTKVGAVIIDDYRRIVSTGYNGFPAGCGDADTRYENRDFKLAAVVHAEVNAVLFAGRRLEDCTLFSTTFPCARCASIILQSGIRRIVCPNPKDDERMQREPWKADHETAIAVLNDAFCHVFYPEEIR